MATGLNELFNTEMNTYDATYLHFLPSVFSKHTINESLGQHCSMICNGEYIVYINIILQYHNSSLSHYCDIIVTVF